MIYAKKNSKSLVKILNPLIVFDENNEFTKTVQNIYKEAQTHSIKVFVSNLIKKWIQFLFNPTACESCAGNCCIGESGYIWINIVEIEALSKYLGLTLDSFREKYLFKVGYKYSIKEVELADNSFACCFLI